MEIEKIKVEYLVVWFSSIYNANKWMRKKIPTCSNSVLVKLIFFPRCPELPKQKNSKFQNVTYRPTVYRTGTVPACLACLHQQPSFNALCKIECSFINSHLIWCHGTHIPRCPRSWTFDHLLFLAFISFFPDSNLVFDIKL